MANNKLVTKASHATNVHYSIDNAVLEQLAWFCSETKLSKTAAVENAITQYVNNYKATGRIK